jgi:6-pyruvoyltetrahydropterin/6-carboxytetrahydropterin synthase
MRRINVYGPQLKFAAAHFTTFGGDCEPLHGHNYAVAVELEGELTPDSWLFDFVELRRIVAVLCDELDHRFLLPAESHQLSIEREEGHYRIASGKRRYVIPEADVVALPIDNSTAERLAEWLAGRLAAELRARDAESLSSLAVTVEEAPGQSASYRLALSPDGPPSGGG